MPGPGGGPPRKSHTKSRNGCRTCKRRHIRCDETFPQCRNCTKHNCRCDYMELHQSRDDSVPISTPPNLMMTPEIDAEIEQWLSTGVPPFPELSHGPRNDWHRFSKSNLRLIHHIAGLSINLHRRGLGDTTVWSATMSQLLAIAAMSDFVMSAVLALSALHMAYVTASKETLSLSYHHRKSASKGLQNALGTVTRENCEAILAASLVLSWQATDWISISTLEQGIIFVLDSMDQTWKESSEIAQILEDQRKLRVKSSFINLDSSSDGSLKFQHEIFGTLDRTIADLHRSQSSLRHIPEFFDTMTELIGFVKQLRSEVPMQSSTLAFTRLQSFRAWIFWLPIKLLRGGEGDLGALAVLAHFYATALVLEPLFPGLESPYLGYMTVDLIENIDNILHSRQSRFQSSHITQLAVALMEVPRHITNDYKSPTQWPQQMHTVHHHTVPAPSSPYHPFDDFPSSYLTSAAPYIPTSHPSFPVAVTSPPYQSSSPYRSNHNFSPFYMSPLGPSPDYHDDALSDYSRAGNLEHSPAISSYGNDFLPNIHTPEAAGSFHPDLPQHIPTTGSTSVTPELWT